MTCHARWDNLNFKDTVQEVPPRGAIGHQLVRRESRCPIAQLLPSNQDRRVCPDSKRSRGPASDAPPCWLKTLHSMQGP